MENETQPVEVQPSEPQDQNLHIPQLVADGQCRHEFEFVFKDKEGLNNARCKKCPVGIAYSDELNLEVVNARYNDIPVSIV